jgi:hypothetical protein
MAPTVNPNKSFTGPAVYSITVEGSIPESLLACLASMELKINGPTENPVSTVTGRMEDQSQLHGVLNTLYNSRYTVLSVTKIQ